MCVCVSPSLVKMLFRNDMFPHDSAAFSRSATQGSGTGMSCRHAARHQAATAVCRLVSAPYCLFVKSHYPNENERRKAATEHGFRWAACQRHSDFIFSPLSLNSECGEALAEHARCLLAAYVMCKMLYSQLRFSVSAGCKVPFVNKDKSK